MVPGSQIPGAMEITTTMPITAIKAPASHPYTVTLSIDPADWRRVAMREGWVWMLRGGEAAPDG